MCSPAPAPCLCCQPRQIFSGGKRTLCGRAISSAVAAGKGHGKKEETVLLQESVFQGRVPYRSTQDDRLYPPTQKHCGKPNAATDNYQPRRVVENRLFPRLLCPKSNKPTLGFLCLGLPSFPSRVLTWIIRSRLPCSWLSLDEDKQAPSTEGDPADVRTFYGQVLVHSGSGRQNKFSRVESKPPG